MPTFTQGVCHKCWDARWSEKPSNHDLNMGPLEVCCYCGYATTSGLYIRVHPETVPYPADVT